jgi:hypothetical protein
VARLHSRIYVHSLAVLFVVGVTTAVVFAIGARDAFRRELVLRTTRHVASLAAERIGDSAALAERLRQIHDALHLDVRVHDPRGRVLASAGDELPSHLGRGGGRPRRRRHRPPASVGLHRRAHP